MFFGIRSIEPGIRDMPTMATLAEGRHGRPAPERRISRAGKGRGGGTLREQAVEVAKFWIVMIAAFALVSGAVLTAVRILSGN